MKIQVDQNMTIISPRILFRQQMKTLSAKRPVLCQKTKMQWRFVMPIFIVATGGSYFVISDH